MVDILHKIGINTSPSAVHAALGTASGLAGWWTKDTSGDAEAEGILAFRFNGSGPDFRVERNEAGKVEWRCLAGPNEWIGTRITFAFAENPQRPEETLLYFTHGGWKEPCEFMHHCSTKWATFMLSLKAKLETGQGRPFPNDIRITGGTS